MRIEARCYAELNDFLPPERRQRDILVQLDVPAPVRHLIVNLGIPPSEVELALINGISSDLEAVLADGDRVTLYPVLESLDVSPLLRFPRRPLRRVLFVADAHLGRLARRLRLLGFDTLYANDLGDERLAAIAAGEGRILLSRDRGLLMRRAVTHGLYVPHRRPHEQLLHVLDRLDLYRMIRPFTRCTVCNGMLVSVAKPEVEHELPRRVLEAFDKLWRCDGCSRVYWQGSHYERLARFVNQLRNSRGKKESAARSPSR